jgi:hypothetical protein
MLVSCKRDANTNSFTYINANINTHCNTDIYTYTYDKNALV